MGTVSPKLDTIMMYKQTGSYLSNLFVNCITKFNSIICAKMRDYNQFLNCNCCSAYDFLCTSLTSIEYFGIHVDKLDREINYSVKYYNLIKDLHVSGVIVFKMNMIISLCYHCQKLQTSARNISY